MSSLAAECLTPHDLRNRLARCLPILPWLFIALGVVLRCVQYFHDRSLFLDEAFVASNISNKSFGELLNPLEFDQRAPAGFLWGVKAAYNALGQSDLALRLVPLAFGIAAVFAFYGVAKRYLTGWAAAFAVFLFALSAPQIYYSSELKQYSADVLACLALLWAFASTETKPLTYKTIALIGGVGAVCVWFSFASVIVMIGLGACFGASRLIAKQWSEISRFAVVGCIWLASFAALYAFQIRFFEADPGWKQLWQGEFMPLPPLSIHDFRFFAAKAFQFTTTLVGLNFAGIGLIATLFGIKSFAENRLYRLALLLSPIAVLFLVSGLKIYPCGGRVILFVAPIMLLLIAEGVHTICSYEGWNTRLIGACMIVLFGAVPLFAAVHHLKSNTMYLNSMFFGYQFEEVKPVMAYIREHWREGDVVYLYSQSNVAFEYYAPQYGFRPEDSIRGIMAGMLCPKWSVIQDDLLKLRGRPRVWVLFSHVWTIGGVDEKKLYLYFLDQMGRQLDEIGPSENSNASAVLYDLSAPTTD